ncbi:transcription factor IIIA-like [Hibiscus syriacus]|uniref:transcription factor IIIA-like n=1 Tax=Hibiscus syriacus TaxID=106335 RepID=UPI00192415D9|nr:transcription factor IIIA-like [Hibiscus syriacus]
MEGGGGGAIFKDIRRYFCEYCGVCRSKKTLITSHILAHHPDKLNNEGKEEEGVSPSNTCKDGASFKKPAHLKQHLQNHSLEDEYFCRSSFFIKKKITIGCHNVKHWIPQNELQNARGCFVIT